MQLVCSRVVDFIDSESLQAGQAREMLFRNDSGFVLYLSDGNGDGSASEERFISLGLREALIWLNERHSDQGSFWS